MTYQGVIGSEIERKDNKADISNLTKYGWKPNINLYQYLDEQMEKKDKLMEHYKRQLCFGKIL